jgi:beta-galactosidase
MTVSEKTLGFAEAVQVQKSNWFSQSYTTLSDSGYQFLLSDTDLPFERLKKYKVLILGSFEFMSTALQKKLIQFADEGGTVVLGPRIPTLNERMQKELSLHTHLNADTKQTITQNSVALADSYKVGKGKIVVLPDLAHLPQALSAALDEMDLTCVTKNDPQFDVTIHKSSEKPDKMVVFVCNPTADPIKAKVGLNVKIKSVEEIWERRVIKSHEGSFSDDLPAYKIKIYECTL